MSVRPVLEIGLALLTGLPMVESSAQDCAIEEALLLPGGLNAGELIGSAIAPA